MNKTIFCDIDGTIVDHGDQTILLPGVTAQFRKWIQEDCAIILTTGRKESLRASTVAMLAQHKIPYDVLLMGLPRGPRIIINDTKPSAPEEPTAIAVNLKRNEGLESVEV